MSVQQQSPGDRLTVFLEQVALPEAQDTREALATDLEAAIENILARYGCEAANSKVLAGHTYTQIEARCPVCRDDLQLIELQPDSSNGAFAAASCQCGWSGEAVYRLIDLYEAQTTEETTDAILDMGENSSVRNAETEPRYYPY